jgi:hypothetical protein
MPHSHLTASRANLVIGQTYMPGLLWPVDRSHLQDSVFPGFFTGQIDNVPLISVGESRALKREETGSGLFNVVCTPA